MKLVVGPSPPWDAPASCFPPWGAVAVTLLLEAVFMMLAVKLLLEIQLAFDF